MCLGLRHFWNISGSSGRFWLPLSQERDVLLLFVPSLTAVSVDPPAVLFALHIWGVWRPIDSLWWHLPALEHSEYLQELVPTSRPLSMVQIPICSLIRQK